MNDQTEPAEYQRIETAARMVRLPVARVRRYVRAGLVRPSRIEGTVVQFSNADLARLRRIRRLGDDLGLNLAGVQVVLRLLDEIQTLRAELAQRAEHERTAERSQQEAT